MDEMTQKAVEAYKNMQEHTNMARKYERELHAIKAKLNEKQFSDYITETQKIKTEEVAAPAR